MRTNTRYNRLQSLMSFSAVFVLLLAFLANIPADICTGLDDHMSTDRQASIYDPGNAFVEIACRDDNLSDRQQDTFTKSTSRNNSSYKVLRLILILFPAAALLLNSCCHCLRDSKRTAVCSRKFIIQYIHNIDGKKG